MEDKTMRTTQGGGAPDNSSLTGIEPSCISICHCERPTGALQSHYRQLKAASRIIRDAAGVTSRSTLDTVQPLRNDNQSFLRQSRKCGFTLAEVLITLGVIGVIAAMTLPPLTKQYEKIVLKNQYKRTYSMLSQNLIKSMYDFGGKPLCYYDRNMSSTSYCIEYSETGECMGYALDTPDEYASSLFNDCKAFSKIFLSNLKIIKTCEDNAFAKGCIPKYKGNDTLLKEADNSLSDYEIIKQTTHSSGWRQQNILNKNPAYVLADGQILVVYSASLWVPKYFAIDLNGKKGPNKWGYDIVAFSLEGGKTTPLKFSLERGAGIEKGGMSPDKLKEYLYK